MTVTAGEAVGVCQCCQRPVRAGEERRVTVEQATSASPEILLHRAPCAPAAPQRRIVRTH